MEKRARELKPGEVVTLEISGGRHPIEHRDILGRYFEEGVETQHEQVEIVDIRRTSQPNNEAVVAKRSDGKVSFFGGGTRVKPKYVGASETP